MAPKKKAAKKKAPKKKADSKANQEISNEHTIEVASQELTEKVQKAEEERIALEAKKAEEARLLEEKRLAEEAARKAEEERAAEALRKAEEERAAAEAAKKAEEERIALEAKKAEEARLLEEKRLAEEAARRAEENRLAAEARKAQEAKWAEQLRTMDEIRQAEERRIAEAARKAEQERLMKDAEQVETERKSEEANNAEQELFLIPPMDNKLKALLTGFVILVITLCVVSFQNTRNYYVKHDGFSVQIWRGTFSPLNSEMILQLPGAIVPEMTKNRYDREEALSIAFSYYIQKAKSLSENDEVPDMKQVKEALLKARSVATNRDQKKEADDKLTLIEKSVRSFKASFTEKSTAQGIAEKTIESGHH